MRLRKHVALGSAGGLKVERQTTCADDSICVLHSAASAVKSKPGLFRFVILLVCLREFVLRLFALTKKKDLNLLIIYSLIA